MVRCLIDRSADLREMDLMCAFNDVIHQTGLIDIPLKNRLFTWSSKRECPILSELDRFFTSVEWSACFPVITLTSLEMVVSDHAPLLMTCKQLQTTPRPFKLELFWLQFPKVRDAIAAIWNESAMEGDDPVKTFQEKTMQLHQ